MKPVVLNIEDRETDSTQLLWALEDLGKAEDEDFEFLLAADSDAALAVLAERKPTNVLLDINLQGSPISNGLDLVPDLLAAVPDLQIVILTTSVKKDDVDRAQELGIQAYMTKSVGPDFAESLNTWWMVFVENKYCPPDLAKQHFVFIDPKFVG